MSFDNTFLLLDDPVIFNTEHYNLQMKCSINYLQLYTPDHRQSIAIEPMTAEPNAFNSGNGLSILNPTEHFNWQINLKIDTHV